MKIAVFMRVALTSGGELHMKSIMLLSGIVLSLLVVPAFAEEEKPADRIICPSYMCTENFCPPCPAETNAVPEPATLLLIGSGVLGLIKLKKRS